MFLGAGAVLRLNDPQKLRLLDLVGLDDRRTLWHRARHEVLEQTLQVARFLGGPGGVRKCVI